MWRDCLFLDVVADTCGKPMRHSAPVPMHLVREKLCEPWQPRNASSHSHRTEVIFVQVSFVQETLINAGLPLVWKSWKSWKRLGI